MYPPSSSSREPARLSSRSSLKVRNARPVVSDYTHNSDEFSIPAETKLVHADGIERRASTGSGGVDSETALDSQPQRPHQIVDLEAFVKEKIRQQRLAAVEARQPIESNGDAEESVEEELPPSKGDFIMDELAAALPDMGYSRDFFKRIPNAPPAPTAKVLPAPEPARMHPLNTPLPSPGIHSEDFSDTHSSPLGINISENGVAENRLVNDEVPSSIEDTYTDMSQVRKHLQPPAVEKSLDNVQPQESDVGTEYTYLSWNSEIEAAFNFTLQYVS